MPKSPHPMAARRGFTVIEIAVILVIIAMMMVIVIPHFVNQLQLRKAQRVKNDLDTLNSAIEHYALDNDKTGGFQPAYADLRKYLDSNTDIYRRDGRDVYGDSYGPFIVGNRPGVPQKTAARLANVAGPDFWSPYQ